MAILQHSAACTTAGDQLLSVSDNDVYKMAMIMTTIFMITT
jgi:hypothetical protein